MDIHIFDRHDHPIRSISFTPSEKEIFSKFTVTRKDLDASDGILTLRFNVPIINIQGFWTPEMFSPAIKHEWVISFNSATQRNFPYMAMLSTDQKNAVTVALTCLYDDVNFLVKMNQEACCYMYEIKIAVTEETEPFDFCYSICRKIWHELLNDYRKLVIPDFKPDFARAAFLPVYCTWYAAHAALTLDYLDSNAEIAARLGFRTFIVDDGWCFDEMKRVSPKTIGNWYHDIGNWTYSEKKLPDFKKHIAYAQSLGLRYLLWTAPFFLGTSSKEFHQYETNPEALIQIAGDSHAIIDPAYPPLAQSTKQKLIDLVRDLKLDGLKIDFLDYIPQDVHKPRGRICRHYFDELIGGIRSLKPDALIEFRQHYATPSMLEYGTQFRAGDVPFDFNENINRLSQIRIVLGDHIPCHADPIYFNEHELPKNVARHMIAALAGVPMFSMDLRTLSDEQSKIVKFWLDFYMEHLETFAHGHWTVMYNYNSPSWLTVENASEKIAILLEADKLDKAFGSFHGSCIALNMSDDPITGIPDAKAFSYAGEPSGSAAETGCMIQFKR